MELWDNPIGTDGFEFVEYTAPTSPRCIACSSAWDSAPSAATAPRR